MIECFVSGKLKPFLMIQPTTNTFLFLLLRKAWRRVDPSASCSVVVCRDSRNHSVRRSRGLVLLLLAAAVLRWTSRCTWLWEKEETLLLPDQWTTHACCSHTSPLFPSLPLNLLNLPPQGAVLWALPATFTSLCLRLVAMHGIDAAAGFMEWKWYDIWYLFLAALQEMKWRCEARWRIVPRG